MTMKAATDALYFIAIVLPPPLDALVTELKFHFREHYGSKAALRSPPHITLHMPFKWPEKREKELVAELEKFCSERESFEVELNNFGCFPPRVIFINVIKTAELEGLQRDLSYYCRNKLNLFHANWRDQPFHPHVTLAFRDLRKAKFAEAWPVFKDRAFTARFTAKAVTLLKHNGREWEVMAKIQMH